MEEGDRQSSSVASRGGGRGLVAFDWDLRFASWSLGGVGWLENRKH